MPFDGISDGDRYVPACLPGTIRSQGFSPSQRFHPTVASWLYFTPHPSLGFRPSEPFPHRKPPRLSTGLALLSLLHGINTPIETGRQIRSDFRALLQRRIRHPSQRV